MSENIEIIPGTTPWVEVPDLIANNVYIYPFCQSDAFVKNYGKADKVLYMPNIYPANQPYLNIYIPKSYITDDTTITVTYETNEYKASETRINTIFPVDKLSDNPSNWKDSDSYPDFKYKQFQFKDIRLYSCISYDVNSTKPTYFKLIFKVNNHSGEIGNVFEIPFTLVSIRKEVPTRTDLNTAVTAYGKSNYDGTMQNLDIFHFDALESNPYLTYCPNCHKFMYDSNSHLCSFCDYSDRYVPKNGLPYFREGTLANSDFYSKGIMYSLCNVIGENGGTPSGPPKSIWFPEELRITNYEEVKIEYEIVPIYPAGSNTDWITVIIKDDFPTAKKFSNGKVSSDINIRYTTNNKTGNDYRAAKIIFTITAPVNENIVTYKDKTLELTIVQQGCHKGPDIPGLKKIYGNGFHTELYVKPNSMNSYPSASTPTQPEFSGDVEFKKSNINVPAKYHVGESILSAKGLTKSDMSKLSTTISESWICNPSLIYRTDINGDAYVLITYIVLENKGEARTGKLDASINGKTTTLTINQIAANDTTTNTDNDLISKPRFEGENNISVKANTKTGSATLNVRNMTEEECTSKVVVYSNASWIKDINVTYTKKDN